MANLRQELFDLVDVAFDKVDPVLDSEYQGGSAEYLRERGESFSNWRAVVDNPALPNFFAMFPLSGILGIICFTRLTTPYYLAAFLTRTVQEGLNDNTIELARNLIWLHDRFLKIEIPFQPFSQDWLDDRQKESFKRVVDWLKQELENSGQGVAMERKKVAAQIEQAFSGVKLRDGVSLLQAKEMETMNRADQDLLAIEERNDWSKLVEDTAFEGHMRCFDYCYFDCEAFRFYLPVMLTRILRFPGFCDGSLMALENLFLRYSPNDLELNKAQHSVVRRSLELVLLEDPELFKRIKKTWFQN